MLILVGLDLEKLPISADIFFPGKAPNHKLCYLRACGMDRTTKSWGMKYGTKNAL